MSAVVSDEVIDKLWEKVDKRGPDECWPWNGYSHTRGYGLLFINGKYKRASRIILELKTGVAPAKELVVCHKCDNPKCVNPGHLFLGTQKENIRDAQNKGRLFNPSRDRTHCKKGHPYDESNTRYEKSKGFAYRVCRACNNEGQRRRRLLKKSYDIHP